MDVNTKWYKLDDQKPGIQLITSLLIITLWGTLFFNLFAFIGSLIFKTSISAMLVIPPSNADSWQTAVLKYVQVSQQTALFIIPGILISLLLSTKGESFYKINRTPEAFNLLMVIMLALMLIPLTMYTGMLNSRMNFPDWLSGLEKWMRIKEDVASGLTVLLLKSSDIPELLLSIFILAVVPAIAEEMIFRGVLQQLLCKIFRSDNWGIWIAAILFSAFHLQFFGFLPRLILGLCFGYLFFWSGNLWLPVLAHFVNNFVPVVMSYFLGWSDLNEKTVEFTNKQMTIPLISLLFSSIILYYFWGEYRNNLVKSIGNP
jgi:membrane protease YdiL (CAAX protease family)